MKDSDFSAFKELIGRTLILPDDTYAYDKLHNIPLYHAADIQDALADPQKQQALFAELNDMLVNQSGVLVIKQAVANHEVIDGVSAIFNAIIARERVSQTGGDHFAGAGANDRIWNSLQKLCDADPALFLAYFGSPAIDAVCEAYLGPAYQVTTQVNLVRPGGKAQTAHRDYHLGFMPKEQAALYPSHVHHMSSMITLQGAIAHCDMPVVSGPTKLLPFSQLFTKGYLAMHEEAYKALFEDHFVQIALEKGDAIFFSPALFHAAGDNNSADIERMANLIQISSMMGRPIETVDRSKMVKRLYPALQNCKLSERARDAAIHAAAEGYAFPTNLDTDPPLAGLASETQSALVKRALREQISYETFEKLVDQQAAKRQA